MGTFELLPYDLYIVTRRRGLLTLRPGLSLRACLSIIAIGLTGCGSPSGPPAGPIVFAGHPGDELGGGYNNLMVMDPDGTGVRRLTRTDGDVAPSWSPDGTKVVYTRATAVEGCDFTVCRQIWIVDADGTDAHGLAPASAIRGAADWSPDGDRLVFDQSLRDAFGEFHPDETDIYVMNVDGSDVRQLTDGPGASGGASWSPDGDRIAFTREVEGESGIIETDAYVMNSDGSEQRRLTHDGESSFSAWLPNGEQIAVARGTDATVMLPVMSIFVLNLDGSGERTLLPPGEDVGGPVWSPDGSQIAFIRNDDLGDSGIWVMDADGGNAQKLEAGPYSEPWGLDWAAASD